MMNKIAIASLLASAALASPFPPSITQNSGNPVPSTVTWANKKPGGGNFMPSVSNSTTPSQTAPQSPSAAAPAGPSRMRRATGEWVSVSGVANWDSANILDGVGNGVDAYTMFWGTGAISQGWPAQSSWVSFEDMFNNYKDQMFASCENMPTPEANDSGDEVGAIWDGIQSAAQATGVDHRFILAIIMQESSGCVRVPTTNYGVVNPGLMQDHDGTGTCNNNGVVQNPCPSATIYQMISDGTAGTASGDGLANCLNEAGTTDASAFYRAARIYNSGSISTTGQLQNGIATHCYASDIANRLIGWVNAAHGCNCDSNPSSCGIVTY